jgi:hypothetical protein
VPNTLSIMICLNHIHQLVGFIIDVMGLIDLMVIIELSNNGKKYSKYSYNNQ